MTTTAPDDAVQAALDLFAELPEGRTREVLRRLLTEHADLLQSHAKLTMDARRLAGAYLSAERASS